MQFLHSCFLFLGGDVNLDGMDFSVNIVLSVFFLLIITGFLVIVLHLFYIYVL